MISAGPRRRLAAVDALVASALGAAVAILARGSGAYGVAVWAPTGAVLLVAAGALLALGYRTTRVTAAAATAFCALGVWSAISPSWGGVPNEAWRFLDQSLIASAALVFGSLLAAAGKSRLVVPAVLGGIVVNAGEILVRSLHGTVPEQWFYGRRFQGAIGYHSAQANLAAIGLALSVALLASRAAPARAAAGASAGLMVSTLLLTQSRAGVLAAALCLVVTIAFLRDTAALLRAVPVAVGAGLLVWPLKTLDRALVDQSGVDAALRSYAAWSLVVMAGIALCAAAPLRSVRLRRALLAAACVVAVAGTAVAVVIELRPGSAAHHLVSTLRHIDTDPSLEAGPGSTRILSLSFNGRRDAWRVAWSMAKGEVFHGDGQGTFPIVWTKERHLDQLYILQPHSIVLEYLSELGAVGLALFVLAVGLVTAALARGPRERIPLAAAAGALVALVGQASVDWTWSFPILVASALALAGAAAGGRRAAPPSLAVTVVGAVAVLVALMSFTAPWAANRQVRDARSALRSSPASAVGHLDSALRWNRWDPAAHELAGVVAERSGQYERAADDYVTTARFTQSPWLERILEARAATSAGDHARAKRACAESHRENPGRTHFYVVWCE